MATADRRQRMQANCELAKVFDLYYDGLPVTSAAKQ